MQRYEIGTKTQLLLKTDMAKMNFTPADDLVDEVWGKIGTPERDARHCPKFCVNGNRIQL